MKKKLLSLLMALVMVFTLLPFNAIAAMRPLEETGSEETENEGTGSEEPGEGTGSTSLLSKEIHTVTHPTYLPSGEISLLNIISADAGLLSFTKGSTTVTGDVKLESWSVGADKKIKFTLSGGKDGDTITLPITVDSQVYGRATLTVIITLGYQKITITSDTTVVFGSTLTLTCAGLKGPAAVIYNITGGSEVASIEGNVLIPRKAGKVTITATQVANGVDYPAQTSDAVVITVTKATPTGSPTFTELKHAGLTLADANLTLGKFSVEGSVDWVLPDSTTVIANTAYEWKFTPKDSENYHSITGSVIPYTVTEDVFAIGDGVTEENLDGSFTTISFGEDDSSYKLTEYPDGSMCMVHTKMDGTVTTTELAADGTRTETIKKKDGSRQITATDKSGIVHTTIADRYGYTSVQVYIPQYITNAAARNGTIIDLPIPEIPCTDDRADAPLVTFTLYTTSPVRVSIPINNPTAGTVAINVAKNGAESVIKTSTTTGWDSIEVTLTGSATIKVADLSKDFIDVDRRHWYKDAADFATSRGLFNGVSPTQFDPNGHMSRAMLVTVLHNLEGNPRYGYINFARWLPDIEGTWYEAAAAWAIDYGHISGYEDGTFRGDVNITREQLAVILYRYAGYPSATDYVNSSLYDYLDYQTISPYAYDAMYWAVCSGVLYTPGGDHLYPQQAVTRAEVAQIFKNLVEFMAG